MTLQRLRSAGLHVLQRKSKLDPVSNITIFEISCKNKSCENALQRSAWLFVLQRRPKMNLLVCNCQFDIRQLIFDMSFQHKTRPNITQWLWAEQLANCHLLIDSYTSNLVMLSHQKTTLDLGLIFSYTTLYKWWINCQWWPFSELSVTFAFCIVKWCFLLSSSKF